MHEFIRTVGSSMYQKKQNVAKLLKRLVKEAEMTGHLAEQEGSRFCKLHAEVVPDIGIVMIDEMSPKGTFSREHYFPCVKNSDVSSEAECSIQRHAERETYAGLLDEYKAGISPTLYAENSMEYGTRNSTRQPAQPKKVALTDLVVQGKVLLPTNKTEEWAEDSRQAAKKHSSLLEVAGHGDEDVMETLTIEDIDLYSIVSRRTAHEDAYSIMETYFMPCGTECNQYSIIEEITEVSTSADRIAEEEMHDLKLDYNDMIFHVAVNKQDLLGEPRIGRRFKGQMQMQGTVVF